MTCSNTKPTNTTTACYSTAGLNKEFTLKKAIELSGKVSKGNTKMPSSTFAISAKHCNVGLTICLKLLSLLMITLSYGLKW